MTILDQDPPYDLRNKCELKFGVFTSKPVFTFGDTIYNPFNGSVDPFLQAHEIVHSQQQGDNPQGWWDDYLLHDKFRFKQELQAYRVQYKVMRDFIKDRNQLYRMLYDIAGDLSGNMYGRLCTRKEAMDLIR